MNLKTKVRISIITAIVITILNVCAQNRFVHFNQDEFFTASLAFDPTASIKENGLNVVAEIEYSGLIYAKAGIENFSELKGGYFDYHGAIGINLMFGKVRTYTGFRGAVVTRNNATNAVPGFEAGIDVPLNKKWFIGIRATYDKRYDMLAVGYTPIWRESGFIRIGYKWDFKN